MKIELNHEEIRILEKMLLEMELSIREGLTDVTISDVERIRSKIAKDDEIVIEERREEEVLEVED